MIINRAWCMPNSNTFSMRPVKALIERHLPRDPNAVSLDPFARASKICKITNDLDPSFDTTFNLDALDLLQVLPPASIDFLLFDPSYSPRQISECYKKLNRAVNMQTTQASFWSDLKNKISRFMKPNSKVISFGWNSGGIGKTNGFEIVEILLVAHGGNHNDTICTVEVRGE